MFPLQALVSEPLKPIMPCVVMSNAIHAYMSQSDKGELVIGAGTDAYASYSQTGALHIASATLEAICELFPFTSRLKMMRNWGGVVDTTPDRSPILGKTPVPGLYVNCGWGAGGSRRRRVRAICSPTKSRPASRTRSPRRSRSTDSDRARWSTRRPPPRSPIEGPAHAADPLPLLRDGAPGNRVRIRRRGPSRSPRPHAASDGQWTEFLYFRANPKGEHAERWRHAAGCGRFFNAVRDTASDRFLATYKIGQSSPSTS